MTCHFKLFPFWKQLAGMTANVKALLSVAEIEKQKLNYADKFI